MAMDLIGLNPTGIEGRTFRRSLKCWHHMWDAIYTLYPEVASSVKYGYSNDGDGLSNEDCIKLAKLMLGGVSGAEDNLPNYINENLALKGIRVPDIADFNDFRIFLNECGGFEIW